MLSRTAEGLFWMARYVERADNVGRLVEAGRRFESLSKPQSGWGNEWTAILIAAGCQETFGDGLETASAQAAIRHLVLDENNPSSIRSSFANARGNARAQRVAVTAGLWEALNQAWRETRVLEEQDISEGNLSALIERTRQHASLFRGEVEGTLLRNAGYWFVALGQLIERADATARLLDVKYHVLLPHAEGPESSRDQLQWTHLLRAAGVKSNYRWVYKDPVNYERVADLLILNAECPRSLRFCYDRIVRRLQTLSQDLYMDVPSLDQAAAIRDNLHDESATNIIAAGLHEYLTDIILKTNQLAVSIATDFGFGPAPVGVTTEAD